MIQPSILRKFGCTLFFLFIFSLHASDPVAVYLTWQHDPTTTMSIQWVTVDNQKSDDLYYRKEGEGSWQIAVGKHLPMPDEEPFLIHRVELTRLSPGATYHIKTGQWESGTYKFRTMSNKLDRPIRFVVGGDFYSDGIKELIETHRQAAKQNPHFALVGGDIAYANTKSIGKKGKQNKRWIEWLRAWSDHMKTPDGYLIPLIPAIGNHDVVGGYDQSPKQAPFFYSLFPFPGDQGFNVLDFGPYLSILVLDTGHTHDVAGAQSRWLTQSLEKRIEVPHKFALYHIPAYPCVRPFKGIRHAQIRGHWIPQFERFSLTAAFEHHDHAYKRTFPIFRGKAAQKGVIYLGDGGYGVKKPRVPRKPGKEWYLAFTASKRHFILTTLDNEQRVYEAIDSQGKVFDRYRHPVEKMR